MNKIIDKMEVQTLIRALIEAKSIKAGIGSILAFSFDFILPLSDFMIGGLMIVMGVGVMDGLVSVKKGKSFTDNGWIVIGKMMLYMMVIIMGGIVESVWLDDYDVWVNIPLVFFLSAYIVLHELENGIDSLNKLTGWELSGVVGIFKSVLKKKVNEEGNKKG